MSHPSSPLKPLASSPTKSPAANNDEEELVEDVAIDVGVSSPLQELAAAAISDEVPKNLVIVKGTRSFTFEREERNNLIKLGIMIAMVFVFFLVELFVGFFGNSLTLLSDAFHMLSDEISLIIGLIALYLSKKPSNKYLSYGWARTEILGGLINGVFLMSVVLFIYMQTVERLFEPRPIESPVMVFVAGVMGLIVNIIGLIMFHGHAHHHHGHDHGHDHGHSHGHSHGHDHHHNDDHDSHSDEDHHHDHDDEHKHNEHDHHDHDDDEHHHHHHDHDHHGHDNKDNNSNKEQNPPPQKKFFSLNLAGVFLHILGDFLGSIAVIISSVFIWFFDYKTYPWTMYIDPIVSSIFGTIILLSAIPLVKNCAKILLQSVPDHISTQKLQAKIEKIKGVLGIHEFHVWVLVSNRVISSLHITVNKQSNFPEIAAKIQTILHKSGIHSSTIQPEFVDDGEELSCKLNCAPECQSDWCCPPLNQQQQQQQGEVAKKENNH